MVRVRLDKQMRKEQIQETALALFLKKEFKNTTMDDIRIAAGLSAGGLYYHYRNTYEILYDIMMNGNILREKIINESLQDFDNQINAGILAEIFVDKMLADNKFIPLYVMFLCEIKNDERLRALFEQLKEITIAYFNELITKLGYQSPAKEEFDFLTHIINSILLGCEILGARENFSANRDFLVQMLETYFQNKGIGREK